MRLFRVPLGWLAVVAGAAAARAETPPDPLRLVPDKADFVFKIEQPRRLVELVSGLDVFKQLQKIDAVREAYGSTNVRRFFQLVGYFEKQLGMKWPELLDRLAGGGTALGVKFSDFPPPFLYVVQSKDEALLQKFAKLALEVTDQELTRLEAKDRPVKGAHRGVETVQIGPNFHAAVAGSALLLANHPKALQHGIDLYVDGDKGSMARLAHGAEARKVLPADPLGWGWVNLATVRQIPIVKMIFPDPAEEKVRFIGGEFNYVFQRSPFVCAGVYHHDNRLVTTLRFPRGREGMPAALLSFLPPADQPATLPYLEPKNVLLSATYYQDLSKLWEMRDKLFQKDQLKAFEEFDKNSGRFLFGNRLSNLLMQSGPHQRIVVAQQTDTGYKTKPGLLFPAAAYVIEMRDPEKFGKTVESILRGAALLGNFQLNLKMVEEKRGEYTIVGYRLPDDDAKPAGFLRNDTNNLRYNFSPAFVRVGNMFVLSTTIELARELTDILDKQAKEAPAKGSPVVNRTRIYGAGGAAVMRIFKDQLETLTILTRAVSPAEAEQQVKLATELVERLGFLEIKQEIGPNVLGYDIEWNLGKTN
jgi:hypothetical protein